MANAEHLKILKDGVDVWNRWREENPDIQPDLSGADLSGADMSKIDLNRANLRGANLSKANLAWADLEGAILIEAILIEAILKRVILFRAILIEANLEGAILYRAILYRANLEGANLSKANLSKANLEGAILYRANLGWANLGWANLSWANLKKANLKEANLKMANLKKANLEEANLRGANLEKAYLRGADLRGADLRGADLDEAYLDGAYLRVADLMRANLERAYLAKSLKVIVTDGIDSPILNFDGIYPSPFRPNIWQDMLIYVYYKEALEKVLADFERRRQQLSGAFTGTSAESQSHIPPDSLLTIIPDIPSVVCEPPSFQFRMTDDYHCQPFRVMHKTTPVLEKLGRGRIKGAVRIYLETLVIGEIPVESEWEIPGYVAPVQATLVSSLAAQPQTMPVATTGESFKRQTARAFRKIFASYADSDTYIVKRLEKAYRALGDDYWLQFQWLRSGQDRSKVIEEAIKDSDVFQLCWSNNAKTTENVEREWRLALAMAKENFIRPIYWERPMPEPPEELKHLYFDYYQVEP